VEEGHQMEILSHMRKWEYEEEEEEEHLNLRKNIKKGGEIGREINLLNITNHLTDFLIKFILFGCIHLRKQHFNQKIIISK
jgi:hypothetical protein